MTSEIGLLVGEALHELRVFAEADDVLTAAEAAAGEGDPLLVHIAEIRSRNVMWGLFRPEEALDVIRRAHDRVSDPLSTEELVLAEALLLTYSGQPLDALAVLERVGPLTDRRARALRAVAEVPALVAVGRSATAAEAALHAFAEHSELPDQIAIPRPGTHVVTRIYALADCGRLEEAVALATFAYEAMPSTAPPDALMWLSHQLGRSALLHGQVETARRCLGEALARCDAGASEGPSRLVLSALATAHAYAGDTPPRRRR